MRETKNYFRECGVKQYNSNHIAKRRMISCWESNVTVQVPVELRPLDICRFNNPGEE